VDRIRLKDSYTHVWWMARVPKPKADNRKVLKPYSPRMLQLLKLQAYNAGLRPSGHHVSAEGFKTWLRAACSWMLATSRAVVAAW